MVEVSVRDIILYAMRDYFNDDDDTQNILVLTLALKEYGHFKNKFSPNEFTKFMNNNGGTLPLPTMGTIYNTFGLTEEKIDYLMKKYHEANA